MRQPSVVTAPYLVAVDGSEASKRAVQVAISQAREDKRTLVIIHVVETDDHPRDEKFTALFIDDAAKAARTSGVLAATRILHGRAREEIIAATNNVDPGLVFVGTSSLTGLEGWILGSVAADIMRHSHKPVVVVPPIADAPTEPVQLFSRMLVPIDPGAEDASTAAFAIGLANETQREIVFCAVVDETRLAYLAAEGQSGYVLPDLLTEVRLGAQQVIDAASAQAHAKSVVAEACIVSGEPTAAICKLASEKNATAIVMATHGRLGLSRMVIGSTTQGVLRASQIPVVTLLLEHEKDVTDPTMDWAKVVDRRFVST